MFKVTLAVFFRLLAHTWNAKCDRITAKLLSHRNYNLSQESRSQAFIVIFLFVVQCMRLFMFPSKHGT